MPNGGQIGFGSGLLAFTPAGSNPTPIICATLQDISLKSSSSLKKLYGQNKVAAAVAEAELAISGTAKFASFTGSLIKQALSGATIATGQVIGAIGETATIPTTPFQVTVLNSANFGADLSVYDLSASKPMTRVASAPGTGQYAVSAGVYTFASADQGHVVSMNYSYTAATGQTVSLSNSLMGAANTFTGALFNQYGGQTSGIKLYSVVVPGLDFTFKNTDFTMLSMPFEAYADSLGRVLDLYSSE
jgi:hypothetical protein